VVILIVLKIGPDRPVEPVRPWTGGVTGGLMSQPGYSLFFIEQLFYITKNWKLAQLGNELAPWQSQTQQRHLIPLRHWWWLWLIVDSYWLYIISKYHILKLHHFNSHFNLYFVIFCCIICILSIFLHNLYFVVLKRKKRHVFSSYFLFYLHNILYK